MAACRAMFAHARLTALVFVGSVLPRSRWTRVSYWRKSSDHRESERGMCAGPVTWRSELAHRLLLSLLSLSLYRSDAAFFGYVRIHLLDLIGTGNVDSIKSRKVRIRDERYH